MFKDDKLLEDVHLFHPAEREYMREIYQGAIPELEALTEELHRIEQPDFEDNDYLDNLDRLYMEDLEFNLDNPFVQ